MSKKILVIGSLNYDLVVYAPRHPIPGETILGNNFLTFPGGKGANQAVAAARLGGQVQMIGRVGQDHFGDELLQNLQLNQVDTTFVSRTTDPTGTALITVNAQGQNSIIVIPGANATLKKQDMEDLRSIIQSASVVVLQLEIPLEVVTTTIDIASEAGALILLNPAPAAQIPAETLRKVTYLIPNESELALLTKLPTTTLEECRQAARYLLNRGCQHIILTRGEHGACYFNHNQEIILPAIKVPVVDTTAAGDAFIGGLATACAEGLDLRAALEKARAAGALAVTKAGAQASLPDKIELDTLLNQQKKEGES